MFLHGRRVPGDKRIDQLKRPSARHVRFCTKLWGEHDHQLQCFTTIHLNFRSRSLPILPQCWQMLTKTVQTPSSRMMHTTSSRCKTSAYRNSTDGGRFRVVGGWRLRPKLSQQIRPRAEVTPRSGARSGAAPSSGLQPGAANSQSGSQPEPAANPERSSRQGRQCDRAHPEQASPQPKEPSQGFPCLPALLPLPLLLPWPSLFTRLLLLRLIEPYADLVR